jgi:hypothetical protein
MAGAVAPKRGTKPDFGASFLQRASGCDDRSFEVLLHNVFSLKIRQIKALEALFMRFCGCPSFSLSDRG